MEERERAHATQLQRAERESTSLRGEIKQIRSRMEAAIHQAAESDQLRAQIRERYSSSHHYIIVYICKGCIDLESSVKSYLSLITFRYV